MFFVRDKGQMCNNILQYAHVYAWGREHGVRTMSMRFAYKYQYFKICHTRYHSFPMYLIAKYAAKFGLMKTVAFTDLQNEAEETRRLLACHGRHAVVEGWFVRFYDLFLKYKQEILQLFAFDEVIETDVAGCLRAISEGGGIRLGVHIRRGDYKTWNNGRFYFDDETYAGYIKAFLDSHGDGRPVTVYICGNDPKLDKDFYRRKFEGVSVVFPQGNPAEDLCLLSHCDWLIGPPSTFSLVASMYHDASLCWMRGNYAGTMEFGKFDELFRKFDGLS